LVPKISLGCVIKTAGLTERMGKARLKEDLISGARDEIELRCERTM